MVFVIYLKKHKSLHKYVRLYYMSTFNIFKYANEVEATK